MNTATKEKIAKVEALGIRARTILAEYEKTGLPPEQDMALGVMRDERDKLVEEIKQERKIEETKQDLENLDRFLNEPVNRIPHGVNPDDDSRKNLLRAGWEIKGGVIYGPASGEGERYRGFDGEWRAIAKPAMYPEAVLFGEIPTDDEDAARFYKKTRAIMSGEYKTAYGKYLLYCAKFRSEAMALNMLSGSEQKALSEGSDSAGGYLVPPDVMSQMLSRVPQTSIFRQYATVQPTGRDTLRWPAVKANSGTYNGISGASIYSSGFVGSWAGETPAFTDTDPSFQTLDILIKKVRVATKLSNDFIADSASDVLGWLATNGAKNMALTEDAGFIFGDGSALQPLGILNAGITAVDIEGSTADTITNTTANAGSAPKLIDLAYKLPAQYVGNARWIMRRTIEGKIRKLVDGSGRYLWPPFTGSAFAGPMPDLLGFPVLHSDWMPDDAQDTQPVAILGDLSEYIIGQRTQISSVILRERFADTDQTGIILFERIGGGIFNTDALRTGIC